MGGFVNGACHILYSSFNDHRNFVANRAGNATIVRFGTSRDYLNRFVGMGMAKCRGKLYNRVVWGFCGRMFGVSMVRMAERLNGTVRTSRHFIHCTGTELTGSGSASLRGTVNRFGVGEVRLRGTIDRRTGSRSLIGGLGRRLHSVCNGVVTDPTVIRCGATGAVISRVIGRVGAVVSGSLSKRSPTAYRTRSTYAKDYTAYNNYRWFMGWFWRGKDLG